MPKDEYDAEDPLELVACAVPLEGQHVREMAECFIEEFRRMRWSASRVYALFRDPAYHGPYSALQRLGDAPVRELIERQFGASALAGVLPVLPDPSGTARKE